MNTLAADTAEVRRAWEALSQPGDVRELRVLDAVTSSDRRPHIESGYFDNADDADDLVKAVLSVKKAKGFYLTVNPVNPALLARAQNRIRAAGRDPTTSDRDILRRTWLPIDLDAVRPAGISSSDEEHEAALEHALEVRDALTALGWPQPILADSGNGGHLLYRVDLPVDDAGLVKRVPETLARRFDVAGVKVDTTTHNPARIWKLYGTPAGKGDSTEDRPHRLAKLLYVPDSLELVSTDLLEALGAPAATPQQTPGVNDTGYHGPSFDLDRWIAEHNLELRGPEPWQGGRKWVFPVCPWNSDHTNRSAFLVQHKTGAIAAGCHHEGCKGKGWHELRDVVEPGWRERRRGGQNGHDRRPFSRDELAELGIIDMEPAAVLQENAPRDETTWGEIEPFDSFQLPKFPIGYLPDPLRKWAEAEAAATQVPVDLPAMLTLAAVSACCAKRVDIEVRAGWREPCNLYVVVVLLPGERKSAVFAHATEPLREHEREVVDQTAGSVREYAIQRRTLEGRLKQLELKAAKTDDPEERKRIIDDAKAVAEELALLVPMLTPRLIVDDCTPERLAGLLAEQGGRIAVMAPEGGVFDLMRGAYSKPGVPVFGVFLQGHSGDDIRVDRVSRPAEFVQRPAITLALTVQPDVIHGIFSVEAFRGRGLLGRILYAIPISTLGSRDVRPSTVDESVTGGYRDAVKALCRLPTNLDDQGRPIPYTLALSPEALDVLHGAMRELEPKLAPGGLFEHFRDWSAKLAGAEVRISALLHMVANVTHWQPWALPITEETMRAGVTIGEYLTEHASAAYTLMGTDSDVSDAEHLWTAIVRRGGESSPNAICTRVSAGDS